MNHVQLHFFAQHIKEAQEKKKKKKGLSKMQQAALLGGGAAMLGLGGLGVALHKGAKETNQAIKGAKNTMARADKASQEFSDAVNKSRETDRIVANETRQAFKDLPDLADSSGFEAAQANIDRANAKVKELEGVLNKSKAPPTLGSDEYFEQMRQAAKEDLYEMMKLRDQARESSDGIKYQKYQKEVRRLATELGEDPDVWSVS